MTESNSQSADVHADTGRKPGFLLAMICVIAIRVIILLMGIISLRIAPAGTEPRFNYENPWMAWDAHHYYEIAANGYSADRIGMPFLDGTTFHNVAYFPVVPLFARLVAHVMPLNVALLLLSNACSIIGFIFLYLWARELTKSAVIAFISVLITATFPGAVSFAAGMTEGPFFMLVALTMWLLLHKRFYAAAICAGIATATRPTGVALAMLVPLTAWFELHKLGLDRRFAHFILIGCVSVGGILVYEAFLWHRYHSPKTYFEAQQHWGQLDKERVSEQTSHGEDRHSWAFIKQRIFSPVAWNRGLALLVILVIVAGLIKPMGIPRLLFLLPLAIFLMTYLPNDGIRVTSIPRYESAAIPIFLLAAIWLSGPRWRPILICLLVGQLAIQLRYAFLFPREIWVG